MCYRCAFCDAVSEPGQPLIRHVRMKPNKKEAEAEIPVCKECKSDLSLGITETQLRRRILLRGPSPYRPSGRLGKLERNRLAKLGMGVEREVRRGRKKDLERAGSVEVGTENAPMTPVSASIPLIAPKVTVLQFGKKDRGQQNHNHLEEGKN